MIRDPSDGSVYEPPKPEKRQVMQVEVSGLPDGSQRQKNLERLERSEAVVEGLSRQTGVAMKYASRGLTPREREVQELIIQGLNNIMIAHMLGISPRTVEDHKKHIYEKVRVPNCTALVHKVLSARIAELEAMKAH